MMTPRTAKYLPAFSCPEGAATVYPSLGVGRVVSGGMIGAAGAADQSRSSMTELLAVSGSESPAGVSSDSVGVTIRAIALTS
jgi:hypothetical protein